LTFTTSYVSKVSFIISLLEATPKATATPTKFFFKIFYLCFSFEMNINFNNKTIVVTGAGQGIGNELCKRLYNNGAKVYAFSRSKGPLDELKLECPNITTVTVDLGNWNDTIEALKILDGIEVDGLVNNAAIAIIKPFLELTESDFDDQFNINFKAVFNVTQQVVPLLKTGSSIVNVSSLASLIGIDGHSVYSATKAALDSFTQSLSLELGPRKIRVNSVNPTVILTKMGRANWSDPAKSEPLLNRIPLRRFGEVSEVVDAIVYFLSEKSSFPIDSSCFLQHSNRKFR
ncbi:L-xylulose reductase, partial [Pseudolycoriella hygida]